MNKNQSALTIIITLLMFGCGSGNSDNDTPVSENNPVVENPSRELNLPTTVLNYDNLNIPSYYLTNYFPEGMIYQEAAISHDSSPYDSNPITNEGATLGRVLFYDKMLSANETVSCSNCHQAEHGFSDSNVLSIGWNGETTRRHSMGLTNVMFHASGKFFWDERAGTLEEQVLEPFQNEVEMGLTLDELKVIIGEQSYYPSLFESAFGSEEITEDRISKALSQFIRSMVSSNSRYDQERIEVESAITPFLGFTDEENDGKNLFYRLRELDNGDRLSCAGCHVSEAMINVIPSGNSTQTIGINNGLDLISDDDLGVAEVTNNSRDIGKFKIPSLRNISVTAPYMHDGRFQTLNEVLEHYSTGIQAHDNLAPPLMGSNGVPIKFNFTEEEKRAMIAFFETLTDYEMLQNEKYQDPFNP